MRANAIKFLAFLHKANQFVIPIYQRSYSWDEKQCQQLWEDILRVGANDSVAVHFIGSIVYVEGGQSSVSLQAPLLVIDGQQRLTTLSILLEALARVLKDSEPIDGFSAKKIRHHFLTNQLEGDDKYFKLLLSDTDKETLKAIVKGIELPKDYSIRIKENFEYFTEKLTDKSAEIEQVCNGIAKLMIVDISLERGQDNPQLIFESMNSTGKALSEADLIRNYILMGLEPKTQSEIYSELWRPMELDFGQEAYGELFDDFMRHYLTIKTGDIPRLSEVYEAFKEYSSKYFSTGGEVRALVEDIRKYSKYFVNMALGKETNSKLKPYFRDLLIDLNYGVVYPLMMEFYSDYESGVLAESDFQEAIRICESYLFRRSICQIPTNSMNKTFAEFLRYIDKDDYLDSVKAHFLSLKNYRRYPDDTEFSVEMVQRDLYNFNSRTYLFGKFENHDRKEFVPVNSYTIEHILPQNPNLSEEWKKDLGSDWQSIQQKYLHTLGNLTLTGYNSEYSDKAFIEKRDMKGGFSSSPLRLNTGLKSINNWNEAAIKARATELATEAVKIWTMISLPNEKMKKFASVEKREKVQSTYSIDDLEYFDRPHVRMLYEVLRKEVLAIDNSVSETVLKHWIAFKAQTNFVDFVPKAKGLRLSINMKFPEIDDPKGMTEDISGKGRWGNGEVSVNFRDVEDLPYVMSLIRQSYEKQMG